MVILQSIDPGLVNGIDNFFSLGALFLLILSYTVIQIIVKTKDNRINKKMIEEIVLNNNKVIETINSLNETINDLKTIIKCQYINNIDLTNALDLIDEVYTGSKDRILRFINQEIFEKNNINSPFRIVEIEKKLRVEINTLYIEDYTLLGRLNYENKPLNLVLKHEFADEVFQGVFELIKSISKKEANITDIKSYLDGYFNSLIKSHQEIITNL